ncbi:MAG: hypothetical protein CME19_25165 [Gemmatimonadetes bacterium]|nr:hypothetical protein [Gemmatimonadota bacterium]
MKFGKTWFLISGALSAVGLILAGFATKATAQWSQSYRTMHRGSIAQSIVNKGWGGHRDNGKKQEPHGFSYPAARNLKVYSGGQVRSGWNHKIHSAGDGIWVMSKTGGNVQIAYGGTNIEPPDIRTLDHSPETYPEAYLGAAHHENWALAAKRSNGARIAWTDGPALAGVVTNYWPAKGELSAGKVPSGHPAIIWNYTWNSYQNGTSFADRVAAGELSQLSEPAWASNLSEDDFPDIVGVQLASSSLHELQWTRRWAQYGNTDYDDFLIQETVIENIGTATQTDIYAAIKNRWLHASEDSWYQGSTTWHALRGDRLAADDWNRSTLAPNYLDGTAPLGATKPSGSTRGADLAQQGHAMLYMHDGDQQKAAWPHNDWGGPFDFKLGRTRIIGDQSWLNEGFLNHPTYFGVGLVDIFPPFMTYGGQDGEAYVAPKDNAATAQDESAFQPATTSIWQFNTHGDFTQPDPGKDSDTAIYDMLTLGGHPAEPEINEMYTNFMTLGPWDLAPGEKAKFVIAYAGGHPGNLAKYSDHTKFGQPFLFAYQNLYNGKGSGITTFAERQPEIPLAEDLMFDSLEKAIQVYNWGYDIPNQPPNIRLAYDSNLQGQVELRWSGVGWDSADPDYDGAEAQDIVGYRIYKSSTETEGPFELLADFTIADAQAGSLPAGVTYDASSPFTTVKTSTYPNGIPLRARSDIGGDDAAAGNEIGGVYKFADPTSKAGFPNWYYVRFYDSGHDDWKGTGAVPSYESSPGPSGAAQLGRRKGTVPVVPSDDIFNRMEEQVRVVPNPYRPDDPNASYQGQQNIRFINLPGRCQIDFYDVTGQWVYTQWNDDLTKGEITWFQFTENRPSDFGQAVWPGTYFWKVTSLMPESMGTFQTGTFVVIK